MATNSNTDAMSPADFGPVSIVPAIETGDCLSRPEFERRYEAMPWLKKAELIEGVVYVGSPVSLSHGTAHARLIGWLVMYADQTRGVECADNATVRLDLLNEVQPDGLLRLISHGQTAISDKKKFIEGAPELVAEISSSSVSRDLHAKLNLYLRHGVREYIVWRVADEQLDWFELVDGQYDRVTPDEKGIYRSRQFPGLWLDCPALLRGEMVAVLHVLNQGNASREHAEFVARLGQPTQSE